jgi:signal-transduction protein with cAMP-binding, CBS, and nucleotidyltransferase domain
MNMNSRYPSFSELNKPIREVVTKRLIGVTTDSSLQEGVAKMVEFTISSLVVTDGTDPVGLITDTDVKRAVADGLPPDIPVEKVMTTGLITVDISTPIREALETMSQQKIKHMLVTEQGDIVGVITLRDLEDISRQRLETYISRE